ncbi:hypothetical protein [Taibaiella koreensis]|uniref:hypothetical protein n=1 Tax=Taibaiella koreensis TaxID=1268548 RepID=UPI000E59B7C5|nr:hypothetical protein [Taibaiella koreensis]
MKTFFLNIAAVLLLALTSIAVTAQAGDPQGKQRPKNQRMGMDTQSNTRIPVTNDPELIRKRDTLPIPPPQPMPTPPDTIRKQ